MRSYDVLYEYLLLKSFSKTNEYLSSSLLSSMHSDAEKL